MSAQLSRLHPRDFYVRLDWLREHWGDSEKDEAEVTLRLSHLRRLFEHLPTRFWSESEPLLDRAGYLRLSAEREEPQRVLKSLALLVGKWERSRPPILSCLICEIELRGHPALARHIELVHGVACG